MKLLNGSLGCSALVALASAVMAGRQETSSEIQLPGQRIPVPSTRSIDLEALAKDLIVSAGCRITGEFSISETSAWFADADCSGIKSVISMGADGRLYIFPAP